MSIIFSIWRLQCLLSRSSSLRHFYEYKGQGKERVSQHPLLPNRMSVDRGVPLYFGKCYMGHPQEDD